jgi:hydrogenase-1 operon protein HyaF
MQNIPTTTEFNIQNDSTLTWNVKPLLHEVKHALDKLINENETSIIDLRSIPLAPGEEDTILAILGQGELSAQLASLGDSQIYETQYAGVWIVNHYNAEGDIVGRFIEVTHMPDIMYSQNSDIVSAYGRLSTELELETVDD